MNRGLRIRGARGGARTRKSRVTLRGAGNGDNRAAGFARRFARGLDARQKGGCTRRQRAAARDRFRREDGGEMGLRDRCAKPEMFLARNGQAPACPADEDRRCSPCFLSVARRQRAGESKKKAPRCGAFTLNRKCCENQAARVVVRS
jgi:hypothetical protein